MNLPSQEYLKSCFRYESDTGKLFWRNREDMDARWNMKNAGKEITHLCHGYISPRLNGKKYLAHRIVYKIIHGEIPVGMLIDHINRVTADNRLENLRMCTSAENQFNRVISSNNTSGIKGVAWSKRTKMWLAKATISKKVHHLGSFKDINDAAQARDEFCRKMHGEFYRRA